jgi:hypothetical protein
MRRRFGAQSAGSYYALFNSAAQYLVEIGFSVYQSYAGHGQVYHRFFNCGVEQLIEFARMFNDLRRRRNEAGYNMKSDEFRDSTKCALQVAQAQLLIANLSDCRKEPLRSQIRTNIREYERKINL